MAYDAGRFHKSERTLAEPGGAFNSRPRTSAQFDEIVARYPPDQRKSAVLAALYLAQEQQGYLTANAMRHVARADRLHAGGRRRRRVRTTRCSTRSRSASTCCRCAARCRARWSAPSASPRSSREKLGIKPGETDADRHVHADGGRVPRRLRSRAGGDGQRRHWHERADARRVWGSSSTISSARASRRSPAAI